MKRSRYISLSALSCLLTVIFAANAVRADSSFTDVAILLPALNAADILSITVKLPRASINSDCDATLDLAANKSFKPGASASISIGDITFSRGVISGHLPALPNKAGNLFSRLTITCSGETSYSAVKKISLRKARIKKRVSNAKFFGNVLPKFFGKALRKSRPTFWNVALPLGTEGPANGIQCDSFTNSPGTILPLPWPNPSNIGHESTEGGTFRFNWTGIHNVLQLGSFTGQAAPLPYLSDAGWAEELKSGPKTAGGTFDWNTGVFPCGYRPGIYFFADENNPQGGIVAAGLDPQSDQNYKSRACSTLADPNVYGGRYAAFASRAGCTLYEVNNFLTPAHFDWVPPVFAAKQGDLILYRWTGEHNIVQVHDVTKDVALPGGVYSGPKTNCVGGPGYSCVNGSPYLGEFLFDTANHHFGVIHISDECAMSCTGHTTGMNMEFDLRLNPPSSPVEGGCCEYDRKKGKACRLIDVTTSNEGSQFDYNVPVNRGDLVLFQWAGKLRVVQTMNANGVPGDVPLPHGVAMAHARECVPGPNMSCLGAPSTNADFLFDVARAIEKHDYDIRSVDGKILFFFHGFGEQTDGFTSQNTGTILYVNDEHPYADNPPCD